MAMRYKRIGDGAVSARNLIKLIKLRCRGSLQPRGRHGDAAGRGGHDAAAVPHSAAAASGGGRLGFEAEEEQEEGGPRSDETHQVPQLRAVHRGEFHRSQRSSPPAFLPPAPARGTPWLTLERVRACAGAGLSSSVFRFRPRLRTNAGSAEHHRRLAGGHHDGPLQGEGQHGHSRGLRPRGGWPGERVVAVDRADHAAGSFDRAAAR